MKKTRKIVTFEPEQDVAKMLSKAQKGGLKLGQILNDAIRAQGEKIIKDSARREAKRLMELANASFNDPDSQSNRLAA